MITDASQPILCPVRSSSHLRPGTNLDTGAVSHTCPIIFPAYYLLLSCNHHSHHCHYTPIHHHLYPSRLRLRPGCPHSNHAAIRVVLDPRGRHAQLPLLSPAPADIHPRPQSSGPRQLQDGRPVPAHLRPANPEQLWQLPQPLPQRREPHRQNPKKTQDMV
uniref:Uncharacterized protein n=1 Tax=Podospora anserina (strain S / ATCC MYA-4624 / DSM 980 / FGSC 10383) TaxID=515849 RepID=A0A090DCY3_PODAN|nr:Putative protein of unknown function [Podospora anserina S mat+]